MHNYYTKFTVPRGPDTGTWEPAPGLGERWQQGQSCSCFKDTTSLQPAFLLFSLSSSYSELLVPCPHESSTLSAQTPGSLTALAHIASNFSLPLGTGSGSPVAPCSGQGESLPFL